MQTFLENLKDPAWLIGVVVVGLLLNLAASYIKSFFDFLAKNFFTKRLEKWADKQAEAACFGGWNGIYGNIVTATNEKQNPAAL